MAAAEIARRRESPLLHGACSYAEAILVAVLLALFARAYLFEAFEIPSGSMEDTLLVGDHIVVDKLVYAPHRGPWRYLLPYEDVARGDVVVFRSPEEPSRDFIKRAIGLAGDTVRIAKRCLYRNGELLSEPYVIHREDPARRGRAPETGPRDDDWGPVTVGPDSFLALGDNRESSRDSRFFGAVPEGQVKGRALFVYWSREEGEEPGRFVGRGASVRRFLDGAVHFFDRTRWGRTFVPVR